MASLPDDRRPDLQVLWVVSAASGLTVRAELLTAPTGVELTVRYGAAARECAWFPSDLLAAQHAAAVRQRLYARGFSDTRDGRQRTSRAG